MNRETFRHFRPAVLVFILLTSVFIWAGNFLIRKGFDQDILIIGNLFLFVITAISFLLMSNGLKTKSTAVFLRGVYGGIMLKLFSCIIAAFIYIMTYKKDVNKPALFLCMGLYIIYTFVEVKALMKLSAAQKNA
jgi:hypothetical protein